MDFEDPRQREAFFALHDGLPREAPGDERSLQRALDLCGLDRAAALRVLDVGCGPGAQTLQLARALQRASVLAVDLHAPYLEEVRTRARAAGVDDRIVTARGDMKRLGLAEASFDLVWSEGAAYLMGLSAALEAWRALLAPGGRMAVTEAVWLRNEPPEIVRRFWSEYPTMTDVAGCRDRVTAAGMNLLGDFVLPESAWWDDYYRPLQLRIDELRALWSDDASGNAARAPEVESVLTEHEEEIALYRDFSDCYGYLFLVMERSD